MKNYILLIALMAIGLQSCTDDPTLTDECMLKTLEITTQGGFEADLETTDDENYTGTIGDDTNSQTVSLQLPVLDLNIDPADITTTFSIVQFENKDVIKMTDDVTGEVSFLHDLTSTTEMVSFLVSYELDDKPFTVDYTSCGLMEASFAEALDYLTNQDLNQVQNRDVIGWISLAYGAHSFAQGFSQGIGDAWKSWWD